MDSIYPCSMKQSVLGVLDVWRYFQGPSCVVPAIPPSQSCCMRGAGASPDVHSNWPPGQDMPDYWLDGKSAVRLNLDSMGTLIWAFPSYHVVALHEACRNAMMPEMSAPLSDWLKLGSSIGWGIRKYLADQQSWSIFFQGKWAACYFFFSPQSHAVLRRSWW